MSGETSARVPDVVGLLLSDAEAFLEGLRWKVVVTAPPSRKGKEVPGVRASERGLRVLRQYTAHDGTIVLTTAEESAPDSEGR